MSVTVNLAGTDADRVDSALSGVDGVERVEQITQGGGAPAGMPSGMGGPPPGIAPPGGAPPAGAGDSGNFRLYSSYEPAAILPSVLKVLGDLGCEVIDLSIGTPSLEDVVIHLTGRELR